MIAAIQLSCKMKMLGHEMATLMVGLVLSYGPLPKILASRAQILRFLSSDKKTVAGVPHFVLLNGICSTQVRNDVPLSMVREVVDLILLQSKKSRR